MNKTVVDRLLPLVESYAEGRTREKELKRLMRGSRCERAPEERGCHFSQGTDPNDLLRWCDPCRLREPIWEEFVERRRTNRTLLRRIEATALRLSLPDDPPEPPEPMALLELMTGDQR